MTQRSILIVPMFLLIFGPKTSGWFDVVSVTACLLILFHFLFLNTSHIPRGTWHRSLLTLACLSLLFLWAGGHCLARVDANTYQVLRFGRVIVNFLGAAALVSIYYRHFGQSAHSNIIRDVFDCLVVHAVIMLWMFYSTPFRDLIVNQVVQADPDSRTYLAKASGYRIAGLTDSWDALSGLQSLGLLMIPILLTQRAGISYAYAMLATPLLLFSVAISGRTGFVTCAMLFPVALLFADLRKLHRATIVAAAVLSVGVLLITGPLQDACLWALESTSLGRTMAMFGWNFSPGVRHADHLGDTFTGILREHYFLPDSWHTLLWGSGGSGRDNWDYVASDNGPVLNLHNLGAICSGLIYGTMLAMLCSGLSLRRWRPQAAGVCVLAVCLIALIDIKVMYVFSRNGFTVMILPVLTCWWELALDSESHARLAGNLGTSRHLLWPSSSQAPAV
jgi:hypothetical protein